MTHFPDGAMTPLARAVSAQIRAEMAVRRMSGRALAAAADFTSHNYVAVRLRDEKSFTLDETELIAEALDMDAAELIRRAWENHGARLELEAEEAQAYAQEQLAAAIEFRSRYYDPDNKKSAAMIHAELDMEARASTLTPEESEAQRAVDRLDRHVRGTQPTRKRAMQEMQDQAARNEDRDGSKGQRS